MLWLNKGAFLHLRSLISITGVLLHEPKHYLTSLDSPLKPAQIKLCKDLQRLTCPGLRPTPLHPYGCKLKSSP